MLIPSGEGHDGQPYFTAPIPNGLIGSFEFAPKGDTKIKLVEHAWSTNANGFETAGTLLLDNGRLEQKVKVSSLGETIVVYQDRVLALADVSILAEHGVPVSIENDRVTGGRRTVFHQAGKNVFDFTRPQPPVPIAGSWANVDGRLGVITVAKSEMKYVQATGYHPGMAVCADILYGSFWNGSRTFKDGEEVARRTVLFLLEASSKQTAVVFGSLKITKRPGGQFLRFQRPDGGTVELPLEWTN